MIRQNAVFDRAEQRSDRPVGADGNEQKHNRVDGEAGYRNGGNADLGQFQTPRYQRLVVTIGEFAAEAGKQKERKDQSRAGKRNQRFRIRPADLEENKEDERGLEKVVAES